MQNHQYNTIIFIELIQFVMHMFLILKQLDKKFIVKKISHSRWLVYSQTPFPVPIEKTI